MPVLPVLPVLPELQLVFREGLLYGGAAEAVLLDHLAGAPALARRRLAAYRSSVMGNLTAALENTYPVVSQLVGAPFFRESARQYLLAHPSESGDLSELGEGFPAFLEAYGPARQLPYLPDVARLEWWVQVVYFAADAGPTELSALAVATPDDRLSFSAAPAHGRLDSSWAVERIWTVHQSGEENFNMDPGEPCRALVGRRDGRVFVQSLSAAEAVFFDALAAGDCLDDAVTVAFGADEHFDLAGTLGRFITQGFFPRASREPVDHPAGSAS